MKKNQISKIKSLRKEAFPRLKKKDKEIKITKEKLTDNEGRQRMDSLHYRNIKQIPELIGKKKNYQRKNN